MKRTLNLDWMNWIGCLYLMWFAVAVIGAIIPYRRPAPLGDSRLLLSFVVIVAYGGYYLRHRPSVVDRIPFVPLAIMLSIVFMILWTVRVPAFFTWSTVAVELLTATIIATRLRFTPSANILLGIGIVLLGAGILELAYQLALYIIHYDFFPWRITLTWPGFIIFFGAWCLWMTRGRIRFGVVAAISGLVTVGLFGSWITTGMWPDVLYDFQSKAIYQVPEFSWFGATLYKASKVTLMFGLFRLFRKERG